MLFICNCGSTTTDEQQQQQNYAVTTITQKKNKKINLEKFHVQFSRAQLSRQMMFRYILTRCTPLVEASSGQEQYYIRSAWHLQSYIRLAWHFEEMQLRRCRYTPSRGIWWPRAVLCKVILTCKSQTWNEFKIADADVPPVEASSGQEQYYIRSAWHLVMHRVSLTFWDVIEKMQMYPLV